MDVDQDRSTGYIGQCEQFPIGADILLQGRQGIATQSPWASVFHFGASACATQKDWCWSVPISDNQVDVQHSTVDGLFEDIEWKVLISALDTFDKDVANFDWIATQESGINPKHNCDVFYDFYPDGGKDGVGGDSYTYILQ